MKTWKFVVILLAFLSLGILLGAMCVYTSQSKLTYLLVTEVATTKAELAQERINAYTALKLMQKPVWYWRVPGVVSDEWQSIYWR